MRPSPAGPPANRLRRPKRQLVSRLNLPPDALPGALALTHRRCGKPSCHCADGQGHPLWSLTFMVHGKKRVAHIPQLWVDADRQRVDLGRQFTEALAEVLVLNAEILVLERKQQPRKDSQKRTAHRRSACRENPKDAERQNGRTTLSASLAAEPWRPSSSSGPRSFCRPPPAK